MLSFATPAWLLGLLLVPVIRWLHRGGPHRQSIPVANLSLWRKAETTGPAAGERRPPDPAWRRRALIAALLALALAGPASAVRVEKLTLWVDDSLSMLTREGGATRLARGLELAAAELAARSGTAVEVRRLSSPWETRGSLDAEVIAALVAGAGEREPASPPAALWRSDREHWLVTDGTGETLEPRPYARVLRVGDVRRNVGLLRLSARRSLEDRSRLDIEIEARNGGDTPDERTVVLSGDSGEIARSTLRLAPGESASIAASTAMSSRLGARLEPNDALEADDSLSLNAGGLEARGTHVDPACPASLVSVLRAHPALMIVGNPADAALAVDCSGTGATSPSALLRFVQGSPPRLLEGPLLWSTSVDSSSRRLGAFAWRTAGRLAPLQRGDSVLLASGTTPLVVRRGERAPPVIETALDTDSLAGDDPAAVPLLVAFLIDEALDASLLDAVAVNARAPDAVLVVPREVSLTEAKPGTATAAADVRRWTRPQLLAALLALLWECVVLLRRLRRELAQAEAWTR